MTDERTLDRVPDKSPLERASDADLVEMGTHPQTGADIAASIEMMRRLRQSLVELSAVSEKWTKALVWLTAALVVVGVISAALLVWEIVHR